MKRLTVTMILLLMAFSLSACSGQKRGYRKQDRIEHSEEQQTEEPSTESDVSAQTGEKGAGQHILIAYFTWAENTHVENPDEIDVDATTSASVLVIPFCTHGTGGLASTIQDIKKDLPDSAKLREPIGVYRPDVDLAQESINEWLAILNGFCIVTVKELNSYKRKTNGMDIITT